MAESSAANLTTNSSDSTDGDKRPDSGTSEGAANNAAANNSSTVDMAEWERRLAEGDLPEDFLEVTEPSSAHGATPLAAGARPKLESEVSTGMLVDIPTVTALNSVHQERIPPPASLLQDDNPMSETTKRVMSTEESDRALALALQKQLDMEDSQAALGAAVSGGAGPQQLPGAGMIAVVPANVHGRLTVTVAEAKLARNYGMARMDPYCRIRIGHSVYETPTSPNGSKEPKWNKTFNVFLLKGTKNIDVEVYDECTFSNDAMVAHTTFPIPEDVFKFMVVDDWFPLSGQEGHEKEGVLHLILSLQPLRVASASDPLQPEPPKQPPQLPTEEQLTELAKMFPNLDREVISSVFVEKAGNQEEIVNVLLQMGTE